MGKEEVIKMLNADITGEIEAILTYLRHNFVIEDCEISREMEEIAIDEMRHVEWLSEKVVKLGGIPTIEHAELSLGGADLPAMLRRDVGLEERAVAQYQEHIDAITYPKIKRLLRKIMNEEIEHQEEFEEILHEITERAEKEVEEEAEESEDKSELTVGSLIAKKKTEGGG